MKALTNNRADFIKGLSAIFPKKIIAPFGFCFKNVNHLKIITLPAYAHQTAKLNPTWEVRTNNKIHAKLAIGYYGILLGSWNFTPTSTKDKHEVGIVIPAKQDFGIQWEFKEYFDKLWERSSALKKGEGWQGQD